MFRFSPIKNQFKYICKGSDRVTMATVEDYKENEEFQHAWYESAS